MNPAVRTVQHVDNPVPRPVRHRWRWAWAASTVGLVFILILHFGISHASADDNAISSGIQGACLDVLHSGTADGTIIDAASCNGTEAQAWTTTAMAILHAGDRKCIAANSAGLIILQTCSNTPGQVWLRDQESYFNPDSGKCLNVARLGAQVQLASCSKLDSAGEKWMPASSAKPGACSGAEGAMVACAAAEQWTAWQADGARHATLLTAYTDGTPYEEWCADFVSYVYKQAGYPFTKGGADGWDENNANDVQYMGFTMHKADSGYVPRAGDVAFFNYAGGHVEIVVSAGKKPTFVYGNSAEIDPETGNGQMKANTIMRDGEEGNLVYYLSPNGV